MAPDTTPDRTVPTRLPQSPLGRPCTAPLTVPQIGHQTGHTAELRPRLLDGHYAAPALHPWLYHSQGQGKHCVAIGHTNCVAIRHTVWQNDWQYDTPTELCRVRCPCAVAPALSHIKGQGTHQQRQQTCAPRLCAPYAAPALRPCLQFSQGQGTH